MFIDRVKIHVKAGNGGNGCVSFYRAKYITNGGPDGGDGGKGGDIVLLADPSLTTLVDFRYKTVFKAKPGDDGGKLNCSGKSAEDLIIRVPVGTVVREAHTNKIMADMVEPGESKVLIQGGRGGKGNQHFATPSRQAPKYAQPGKIAKEYDIILELKLIADIGIIGFPNVGKSSLLAVLTNANPKIANYHFTTLSPNLGVVRSKWGNDFVLADIPGLVEGASEGIGLGHQFLRHVERTKVLLHVVDVSQSEGREPIEDIECINNELKNYNPKLLNRPQIIVANKMDLNFENIAENNYQKIKQEYEPKGFKVFATSTATGSGLTELVKGCWDILQNYPEDVIFESDFDEFEDITIDEKPINVEKIKEGVYKVTGEAILKMLGYTNLETEKGFAFFQKYLRDKGIIQKLEELGINEGDLVKLYDLEFDYFK